MRRTTATTEYLKECMGTALLELMREKPLEKISIEEMTARADVGRSTYFRYFKNKEEVLSFKIVCLWKRFDAQHHVGEHTASDEAAAARMFFEFCLSMREVSDLLYATGHQGCILDAYLQILRPDADGENALEYYRQRHDRLCPLWPGECLDPARLPGNSRGDGAHRPRLDGSP